jgi:plasmid stabilization system protein ParE
MSLRFHEAARAEFHEAAVWYEQRDDGLGLDFVQKVKDAVGKALADSRKRRKRAPRGPRTVKLERFPYRLVYVVRGAETEVVAVMHLARDPDYWKDRL